MKIKRVLRYDPGNHLFRVFRCWWTRGEGPGTGRGFDEGVTVALCRNLFRFKREYDGWILRLLFLRLHYERSYGGCMC